MFYCWIWNNMQISNFIDNLGYLKNHVSEPTYIFHTCCWYHLGDDDIKWQQYNGD